MSPASLWDSILEICSDFIDYFGDKLSNGHSPANLANLSTRQKFAVFGEYSNSRKRATSQIFVTRAGKFGKY
jgi:hypothetical protein